MKTNFISLFLISISTFVYCQYTPYGEAKIPSNNLKNKGDSIVSIINQHDLGLHGLVTWLSNTKVRVEYDWSDATQLLDWTTTNGSTLIPGSGTVTVSGGSSSVRSMVWKQLMKCTRLFTQDAKAVNSSTAHLNFMTNVLGWSGSNFNPPEIIGLIYIASGNIWLDNAGSSTLPGPAIVLGNLYTIDINISETAITAKSSSDNVTYSHNLSSPPDYDRQVSIGGWGGDTQWGKITIEGEISPPVLIPSDVINIQTNGATFAPVIQVVGSPTIEWVFNDATTSASATPIKNYGSIGSRHNYLKVTPWSALVGINVGYDGTDGGYGGFAIVSNQNVSGIQNLSLAMSSLQYLCASYSPLTELDLREMTALKFVELLYCQNLATLQLGAYPVLERLCVEGCNLNALDISGCVALKDFRSALNNYTSINWGSIGSLLWHLCVRSNPKLTVNIPPLTQFPLLRELLIWDSNQTGPFVCHSSIIKRIDSYDNHYTSADISGCTNLTQLSLSGSLLASLNLGTASSLIYLQLKNCGLTESQTDYVLQTLYGAGMLIGSLDLSGNAAPSASGLVYFNYLKQRGWTIIINSATDIIDSSGNDESVKIIVSSYEIKILLKDDLASWKAGLYDLKGNQLLSKHIESDIIVFDISSFSSGIYVVVLSNGDNKRVAKVIKP
jgi:hypothetical protein